MKEAQSLLKLLADGLKVLAKGADALAEKVDELATTQDAGESKSQKPARTASKKKEGKSATIAEAVCEVISRSQKGASTSAIMKKTGLTAKQVSNIVFRLKQQGRIKSVGKGIYVKA